MSAPERLGDLLPGVARLLADIHHTVNGEPPMTDRAAETEARNDLAGKLLEHLLDVEPAEPSGGVAVDAPMAVRLANVVLRAGWQPQRPALPADLDEMRQQLCTALAISPNTSWEDAIKDARSAGIVRDAEYRAHDRIAAENAELRAALAVHEKRVGGAA